MAVKKAGQTILVDGLDQLVNLLTSPNVPDANQEPSNVVDVIDAHADAIWAGLVPKGDDGVRHNVIKEHADAIRGLSEEVRKGLELIGGANHFDDCSPAQMINHGLHSVADAIRELAGAVREAGAKKKTV
jgi:hypothetical protein